MPVDGSVSNWTDAGNVEMPPCPACTAVNRPGVVYIEQINGAYYCTVCSCRWLPTAPLKVS